jgi:hypothetical protein
MGTSDDCGDGVEDEEVAEEASAIARKKLAFQANEAMTRRGCI